MPDDNEWTTLTLGEFIRLVIDVGLDPAIIFRIVEDFPSDDDTFVRRLEVFMIPQGKVKKTIAARNTERISKALRKFIEAGLIS